MKEKGKDLETTNSDTNPELNFASSEFLCKKHPSPSPVGICADCLKDRLMKLVCSDCGEQRLSSCSCSELSSYTNSCVADVGSVGRISFLIENEKTETQEKPRSDAPNRVRSEGAAFLQRSNSSCVETKRKTAFWKIGRLFGKRKTEVYSRNENQSETWVSDFMAVSRSRSLCSFRGGGFRDPDEESSVFAFSSAKISDVTDKHFAFDEDEPRKSAFRGLSEVENAVDLKAVKKGSLLELDGGSNFQNRSVFPVRESDFCRINDSGFIDLKLDLSSDPNSFAQEHGGPFGGLKGDQGYLGNFGSCRITVSDRGVTRKGIKGPKVWKWIFRHHHGGKSMSKKEEK